jgi:hypothetical protein
MSDKFLNNKELDHSSDKLGRLEPLVKKTQEDRRTVNRWFGYGLEFGGVILLFGYGGYWADQKLHHQIPWLMLIMGFIAFAGMFYQLLKEAGLWRR